jgi:hypothetical protein
MGSHNPLWGHAPVTWKPLIRPYLLSFCHLPIALFGDQGFRTWAFGVTFQIQLYCLDNHSFCLSVSLSFFLRQYLTVVNINSGSSCFNLL